MADSLRSLGGDFTHPVPMPLKIPDKSPASDPGLFHGNGCPENCRMRKLSFSRDEEKMRGFYSIWKYFGSNQRLLTEGEAGMWQFLGAKRRQEH